MASALRWLVDLCLCCLIAGGMQHVAAQEDLTQGDPLGSMQWPSLKKEFLPQGAIVFDDRVKILSPQFAEDAQNVPVQLDASALQAAGFNPVKIRILVDRNPIRHVLDFEPLTNLLPVLSFRFKLEQTSPVRVAVLDQYGSWHVGSREISATGGGCTVSGATRKDGSWTQTLNQVHGRLFAGMGSQGQNQRMRLMVMHPMDTGLVAGIPPLYLEQLQLTDANGQLQWRLSLHEPVSENPLFSFDFKQLPPGELRIRGFDNNGNRIDQALVLEIPKSLGLLR